MAASCELSESGIELPAVAKIYRKSEAGAENGLLMVNHVTFRDRGGLQKHQANLQWERRLISYGLSEGALVSPQKQNRKIAKSTQQSALIYLVASGNIRSGSAETRIY